MEYSKWANLIINILVVMIMVYIISGVIFFLQCLGVGGVADKEGLIIVSGNILFYTLILLPIINLKKIIQNVIHKKFFVEENSKRFKYMAYPIFTMAVINCFFNNQFANIQLLAFGNYFSIKTDTILLAIIGFLALTMSYIFDEARLVKKEAEELKEENKYTI